ncbi:MAG TPA: CPBP family intramembrane glutamic endopeptidase [Lacunisphaera sp.]|nr:CPBP family intramembrane glutamic endopeptidase [Lacunisphaera sp.]
MPTEPVEIVISAFELGLLLLGAFVLFRVVSQPARRERWLGPRPLPPWPVTLAEFLIFVLLIFGAGVFFSIVLNLLARHVDGGSDRVPLQLVVNGLGLDGGGLVGWWLFHQMQRTWRGGEADLSPAAVSPPDAVVPALPWPKALLIGAAAWVVSLPLIVAVNAGWTLLLRALHLPDEPQDLIAIFANAKSPWVVTALLLIACGLAPVYEEFLFRAGLYRFCRQKLGRPWALVLSGCLFGALHQNLASFVPLALFGMCLAVAYEATGSIVVPIVAHALFNLNTVLIVLAGLS